MQESDWVVGVDIGGTKVCVAAVNKTGKLLEKIIWRIGEDKSPETIESAIIKAIHDLKGNREIAPLGIGIGVAGQVEEKSGLVHFVPNLGWHNVPLKTDLERVLNLPVYVLGDVTAALMGEWVYGAAKGCQNVVCMLVGTGIGGGMITNGEIVHGSSNAAGEIGHMVVDFHGGRRCTCGNSGCLEAIAGGWAIAKRAKEAVLHDPKMGATLMQLALGKLETLTARHVIEASHNKDPLAMLLVEETLEALIAGAVSLVQIFNPKRLLLGGGIIQGCPEFIDHLTSAIHKKAFPAISQPLEVLPLALGVDAGAIGAAAAAMKSSAFI